MGFEDFLGRVNAAHPWSHNDAFTRFVLRNARAVRHGGGTVAADVGCGTGNLVERLTEVFPTVVGIERDAATAELAAQRLVRTDATIIHRSFGNEPPHAYDLVTFVASLHHMPLRRTLEAARDALRPRGRLVIVGIARESSRDALRSTTSAALNPFVGLIRHPGRAVAPPVHMNAPTAEPRLTFEEILETAADVLPGVRMRRRLFWRYTATWTAPPQPTPAGR